VFIRSFLQGFYVRAVIKKSRTHTINFKGHYWCVLCVIMALESKTNILINKPRSLSSSH